VNVSVGSRSCWPRSAGSPGDSSGTHLRSAHRERHAALARETVVALEAELDLVGVLLVDELLELGEPLRGMITPLLESDAKPSPSARST
jgi:hypothetical protein